MKLKNNKFNDGDEVIVVESNGKYNVGDTFIVWIDPDEDYPDDVSWPEYSDSGIKNKYLKLVVPPVKHKRIKLSV